MREAFTLLGDRAALGILGTLVGTQALVPRFCQVTYKKSLAAKSRFVVVSLQARALECGCVTN